MNATMLAELKKRQSGESVEEPANPSRLSSAAAAAAPGFTPCRSSSAQFTSPSDAAPLDDVATERMSSAAAQASSKSARVVFLMAPSVEEKERWVRGIRTVLEGDPVEEVAAAEAKREEADAITKPELGRQVSGAL